MARCNRADTDSGAGQLFDRWRLGRAGTYPEQECATVITNERDWQDRRVIAPPGDAARRHLAGVKHADCGGE